MAPSNTPRKSMRIENAHISSSPLIQFKRHCSTRFRIITAKWQLLQEKSSIEALRQLGFAAIAGWLFAIQPMQARWSIPTQESGIARSRRSVQIQRQIFDRPKVIHSRMFGVSLLAQGLE